MNDNGDDKNNRDMEVAAVAAFAYYDPTLHREHPDHTHAFALPRRFTEFSRVANLLVTDISSGPQDPPAEFKARYPDAVFKGILTMEGDLLVEVKSLQIGGQPGIIKLPPVGPLIPLENIVTGPIPRLEPPAPELPKKAGLRLIVSNAGPGGDGS